MAGLVQKGQHVVSIPISDEIDRGGILSHLPKMGVVYPENPADEYLVDNAMRDEDKGLAGIGSNHLLHSSHRPDADFIQAFPSR